ncbi:MAG: transporter substrate-binding domain-containing protein [Pseudomonadota bacterium]|nr:transporter substrate-binding domain-containing protein [Pseudomonadota bacterium]
MKNTKTLLFKLKVVISCCVLSAAHAALADNQNVLPIIMENFPPFEFKRDGVITGFNTEIITQVIKRMGYEPEIKALPWARAQLIAQNGQVAAIYGMAKNPEREQVYYFSDPISTVEDVFFKLKSKSISWQTLDDLKDYRVGYSNGYGYIAPFWAAVKNNKFKGASQLSGENLELRQLQELRLGRIDIAVCEVTVCNYLIQTNAPQFDMIVYIDQPLGGVRTYHIGFSKKWPGAEKLAKQFNVELAKFIAEGKRRAIFEKYGVVSPLEQ